MKRQHYAFMAKMDNNDICTLIDQRIKGRNAARNREILKFRLIDGMTFEQLGEPYDLTPRAVQYIVYAAEDKPFKE